MLRDFSVKGKARVKVVDELDGTTTYDINLQKGEMYFKSVEELTPYDPGCESDNTPIPQKEFVPENQLELF